MEALLEGYNALVILSGIEAKEIMLIALVQDWEK